MTSSSVATVRKPLPLRLGNPGYFSHIQSMWNKDVPVVKIVTLTSSTCPFFSLTMVERFPQDYEYFENSVSILSAFQNNCKVVSSNLVDMSTKVTWSYPIMLTELSRSSLLKLTPVLSGPPLLNKSECSDHSDFGHGCSNGWSWTQQPSKKEFSQWNSQLKLDHEEATKSMFADPVGSFYRTLKEPSQEISTTNRFYRCGLEDCRKKFFCKEELTRHMKTHSQERAFQCEVCKRTFGRKDHWRKHVSTHTDLSKRRSYICLENSCGKCYTHSDALSCHRNAAHRQRPK